MYNDVLIREFIFANRISSFRTDAIRRRVAVKISRSFQFLWKRFFSSLYKPRDNEI